MMYKALNLLNLAEKYYSKSKTDGFKSIFESAQKLFINEKFNECIETLSKLPDEQKLLALLIEKLKGKSVYTTLSAICSDAMDCDYTTLKGLMSLSTHVVIECEQGRTEYGLLLEDLYRKIGSVLFAIK